MANNTINLLVGGSLELVLTSPAPAIECMVALRYDGFTLSVKAWDMAYTLPVDHLVVVQVSYVDSAGNPASVDAVQWTSSNSAVVMVAEDANDPTMCTVTPGGPIGTAQVTAEADVDMGSGVKPLLTTFDVSVVAGEAVAGTINVVGDPQPIAPHPEPQP